MKIKNILTTISGTFATTITIIPVLSCSSNDAKLYKNNTQDIKQLTLTPSTILQSVLTDSTIKTSINSVNIEKFRDVQTSPNASKDQIKSAFNKFSINMDFNTTDSTGYGFIAAISQNTNLNRNKKIIKVMIVGTPVNKTHSNVVYYCGLMGTRKNPDGSDGPLVFLFKDFESIDKIGDNSSAGSVKTINMNPNTPIEHTDQLAFAGMVVDKLIESTKYLIDLAKQEFPDSHLNIKIS